MKKLLILGATGFIGKNVAEYLEASGIYKLYCPSSKEVNLIEENEITKYLKKNQFDIILHMANYGVGIDKSKDTHRVLEYLLRMYTNLAKNNDLYGKLIHLGSGAEYDKRYSIVNVREEDIGRTVPIDQYGLAKYTINQLTQKSENIYNLRLFGIYGKYEYWQTKFISNVCCKAIKGVPISIRQNMYFDYLWIDDFCRILEWFLDNEPQYCTYNIATGKPVDLCTIANKIIQISGKQLPVYICREGLASEYTANNQRLMAEIPNFQYTDIDECIHKLYHWYEHNESKIELLPLLYQ